jgi:hypothetical protein
MDSILWLSQQVLGLWLAIVGVAIAFGVLYAVGESLRRRTRHRSHAPDDGGRSP